MKNFKYPVAIEGSREELETLIPKLVELGYNYTVKSKYPFLVTNLDGTVNELGFSYNDSYFTHTRTVVSASNPDLVLALAACTEDDVIQDKEYLLYYRENRVEPNDGTLVGRREKELTSYRKATKEEIIAHFNKQPMEKKIIGYKFKPGFEQFKSAGGQICFNNSGWVISPKEGYEGFDNNIGAFNSMVLKLKQAGVLDLWFEPVYEPEKPKVEIVTLRCEGGSFEVEVSKEGIYYRKDGLWLHVDSIKVAIDTTRVPRKIFSHGMFETSSYFEFTPSHIDSGCKKQVPVEDWKKVLEVYEKFNK